MALSERGLKALYRPPLLRCALFDCQFSESNEDGLINLGVAENSLNVDWLMSYFSQPKFTLSYQDFTYGSALGGSLRLYEALRTLTSEHFGARVPVERDHVIAGAGCSAVIDLLVSCLADPGDSILIPRPFYNGFVASFECRSLVNPVGVELPEGQEAEFGAAGRKAFQDALDGIRSRGGKARAVMLSNPHNPLGFCYSKETLLEYCRFCEENDLHLISDEIYALSVYDSKDLAEAQPFVSLLSIDPSEAPISPSRLHVIYGASKDWCLNGFRLGALISQHNPQLHVAMESSCLLMKISSPADVLWSGLLKDGKGREEFLSLNRRELSAAYAYAAIWLKHHSIPFRPPNAGHFIWIDLRSFLPTTAAEDGRELASDAEREDELYAQIYRSGINIGRGAAYSHPVPGFFRLTFTLRPDYFEAGLARLERALGLQAFVKEKMTRQRYSSESKGEHAPPPSEPDLKQVAARFEQIDLAGDCS